MATTVQAVWAAVYVAVCLASYVTGSDIVFTSTPSNIRPLETDALTLRCSLKDSAPSAIVGKRHILSDVMSDTAPSDVSFVYSIMITKSGMDLASISVHLPAKVFDNTTGVQVSGQIPGSGAEKGFLQVSWKYPSVSGQSGIYKCDIRGMDKDSRDHDFSQTLNVTETALSLNDLVGYIHQLKLSNTDLKVEVNDLKTKLDTHVIFTAIRGPSVVVPADSVLVFDQLKTSVGGGYDASTGVFTCPVAGYYVFDVHLQGQQDKDALVCLTHNNNDCVTGAWADDGFDYNSASTSASLQLQRGDTVKVVSSADHTSYVEGWSYGFTSFTGQLVAVA